MDLTGLQYNKRLYTLITGALRALSEFMAEHYVELIKYFVLVNVPSFVYAIWTIAKPLLPERTRQKVRILSSASWQMEILEYSSKESLPSKWNETQDYGFTGQINLPINYPEEDYHSNQVQEAIEHDKLRIVAGKNLILCKELKKGEKLHWWMNADADFGMGVFFAKNKEETNIQK